MEQAIYKSFASSYHRFGDHEALVDGDKRFSYRDLGAFIDGVAGILLDKEVGKGARVGMLMGNEWEFVAVLYALFKIGAVPVLFNTRLTPAELSGQVSAAQPDMIVTSISLQELAQQIESSNCEIWVCGGECVVGKDSDLFIGASVNEADLGLVMFTSGSTGSAKAVAVSQGALAEKMTNFLLSKNAYADDDVFLLFNPLFHQGGFSFLVFLLACGSKIVLQKSLRASYVVGALRAESVTQMLLLPPSLCNRIKACPNESEASFPSVRRVTLTGGGVSPAAVRDVLSLFPSACLSIGYGHTEGAASLSLQVSREDCLENPAILEKVGTPDLGCEVRLLDDRGDPVGPNEVGQLWARSSAMFDGYLGHQASFVNGWFPTGDLMECDDEGLYRFVARRGDMVKSGGENVYPSEVEHVLESHPAVEEAAVFPLPHAYLGEMIAAAVVLRSGSEVTFDQLVEWCRLHMASYKKPRAWIRMVELPRTPSGKKSRHALRERCVSIQDGMWFLPDTISDGISVSASKKIDN
ncbi:class I adenylate-forming enzyme family protein [Adlercreutzia sp. R21]|uniref:class I adenylate-forming enzyme family protein n=1 Tax=Adlercreutzia wanghongyangiae TaxID=3111451 RepID=UPI002DB62C04|nr:class I adenylate-forming enzyme family protein [Adlercreutzia sp. R21]MEC4183267.1 class I adenylate-forming enzyme family protein [Adlercreutzia sp. R21]